MAKRLATYRIDGELADAVAARAAERGETVTDVITRAFREYVSAAPRLSLGAEEPPPPRNRTGKPAPCPHRIRPGSYCKTCGRIT